MPYITLLSDFGLRDASVASAKGILMQQVPVAAIVDITHEVEPFHLQQAAYLLAAAYKNFPGGTCHILLFDVFSEKNPRLLLCEKDGHYFLSPDNGLLSIAFENDCDNLWQCFELNSSASFKNWLMETGNIVNLLQSKSARELNLPTASLKVAPQHCHPIITANSVECQVIHIDRYENVVINITRQQFEKTGRMRPFRIQFMRDEVITKISTHYNDVEEGEKLCRFNSNQHLKYALTAARRQACSG